MTGVLHHPWGPRVYVAGLRVHHGSAGAALALAGLACRRRELLLIGVAAAVHDARDFPWRDGCNHPPAR